MKLHRYNTFINEANFPSKYDIGDKVDFYPMARHCNQYSIERELCFGIVVAVRFTGAKVLYDIVDDYLGVLFDNVDSVNLDNIKSKDDEED